MGAVRVGAPTVAAEGGRLTCVAPAFEGAAEVIGAVWTDERDAPCPKANGLDLDDPTAKAGTHLHVRTRAAQRGRSPSRTRSASAR